jgi:DNA-binding CsgD family transcriptional regulator
MVARSHLFGTFVQSAALNLLNIEPRQTNPTMHLSRREYECLQWAAEGKTAWETGMILSIAEGSVAKVLAAALRKLECATKPQAVVKALRLGLIH